MMPPFNAIPVHMFNGMWGVLLASGLATSPRKMELVYGTSEHVGWFYSMASGSFDAALLGCQVTMILFILGWTFFTMMPFFVWLNCKGWLRADSLEELVGLGISYHGGMDMKDGGVKKVRVSLQATQKGAIRERRGINRNAAGDNGWQSSIGCDPDFHQETAANEALEDWEFVCIFETN
jgi:hypothetical protein